MADHNRVAKELRECQKDTTGGITVAEQADVQAGCMAHWSGTIKGPVSSPYEGGTFSIDIVLPKEYPFVPPKMKFSTKIWHPNISSQCGAICLDILKNEWSPALTVRTALISLQALMSAPEPDDPQDAVVAKQYKENQTDFVATAKYWTEIYAMRAPRTRSARAARRPSLRPTCAPSVAAGRQPSRAAIALYHLMKWVSASPTARQCSRNAEVTWTRR